MVSLDPALPGGALILQTGLNGFIASHIALAFFSRGHRVRGTVRSLPSDPSTLFPPPSPSAPYLSLGMLEIVCVPDLTASGAFDDAVKGVSTIIHTASVLTFDTDPTKVIDPIVKGLAELLRAAKREGVKRFIYTSSAPANSPTGTQPLPDGSPAVVPMDKTVHFDKAVEMARAPPPHGPQQGGIVYLASKVEAEKSLWKFVEEEKSDGFEVNVVSPYTTVGRLLNKEERSVPAMIRGVYRGERWPMEMMSAFMFCHVSDVALLHVAAALDPDIKSQRIQAWSSKEPFNWNDVLAIFRRIRPGTEVMGDLEESPKVEITTDDAEARRLLQKWGGQEWKTLEEGVRDALKGLE